MPKKKTDLDKVRDKLDRAMYALMLADPGTYASIKTELDWEPADYNCTCNGSQHAATVLQCPAHFPDVLLGVIGADLKPDKDTK